MKRKIHVVPHTHWDKEWYFTVARSSVYLMKDMQDILDVLEKDEHFLYFLMDGQVSLLEDYLMWRPEDKARIQALAKAGRLILGPWYTQSDLMLASGESLMRNLYYGMRESDALGNCMKIAYVPDSFGQAGNMPQIYHDFHMESTVFWRGVSDEMASKINFLWEGDDGTRLFATQLPSGYYTAFQIPEEKSDRDHFWKDVCIPSEAARSATKNVLITNGFDQAPIRHNLSLLIAQRNQEDQENTYCISSLEQYIADTRRDINKEQFTLEIVHGELLSAKHMRVHKSIYSSRADLKKRNTEIQNYVTHIMEPLLSISYTLGHAYPSKAVEEVWKLLLENAAHDSMGTCISDSANEDVYMRYKRANDIAAALVELHSRMMAVEVQNASIHPYTLTMFNLQSHPYEGVVYAHAFLPEEDFILKDEQDNEIPYVILHQKDVSDYVKEQSIQMNPSQSIWMPEKVYESDIAIYLKQLPAMGYQQLQLSLEHSSRKRFAHGQYLENEYYRIDINTNGSLNILDKKNNHMYSQQAVISDNGEDGDSFNYSPPRKDVIVTSMEADADIHMETSSIMGRAMIRYELCVPYDLNERAQGICSHKLPIELEVRVRAHSEVIEIKVTTDNNVLSHRVCIHFNTNIASRLHYADQQFGTIQRPNIYTKEMESYHHCLSKADQKVTSNVINWDNNPNTWQEPMIPIEPTQSFVSLSDGSRGMAVFPQAVREYEITGEDDDTISITLFRTYGVMGRENLLYRPGRSSGERTMKTPDAQLLKKMSFSLGVYYYAHAFNEAQVSKVAKDFNTPVQAYGYGAFLNGRILFAQEQVDGKRPSSYSLFQSQGSLTMSAVKKWEHGEGILIRLFNGQYKKQAEEQIRFEIPIEEAYLVDGNEHMQQTLTIQDNTITIRNISHCKYISILVILKSKEGSL